MGKVNLIGNQKIDEMVITPGGLRPKSNVHLIEKGYHISGKNGLIRKIHTATGVVVKELGQINTSKVKNRQTLRKAGKKNAADLKKNEQPAPISDQWIIYSGWQNDSGSPISYFSTTWVVPPAPATDNGQLIYLFNGIENSSFNVILQPVLQWGSSPAGGGSYWAIANWYVGAPGTGLAMHGSLVPVNPGDNLRGIMSLTNQSGGLIDYNSSFEGFDADFAVKEVDELTWANETLECYSLKQFSDYPNTNVTPMTGIEIKIGSAEASIVWQAFNTIIDNGQHCDIVSNSSPNGEVDLYYK